MDSKTFILLYNSLIRPHLDDTSTLWCTNNTGDIEVIEEVQKRATKLAIQLNKLPHTERLKEMHLAYPQV